MQMQNNSSFDSFVSERLNFSYEAHTSGGNKMLLRLDNMVTSVSIFNSNMLMEMEKLVE